MDAEPVDPGMTGDVSSERLVHDTIMARIATNESFLASAAPDDMGRAAEGIMVGLESETGGASARAGCKYLSGPITKTLIPKKGKKRLL